MPTMRHAKPWEVVLALALGFLGLPARGEIFGVQVETGPRQTSRRDRVGYDLYLPVTGPDSPRAAGRPVPPWPALVLCHGFARDKRFHATAARHLAERGIAVLVPNLVSLLGGDAARQANVENTRDHLAWLAARARRPSDPIHGLVDPDRLALAGFSAGGAVTFEAAVSEPAVRALVLLDALCVRPTGESLGPWKSDLARMVGEGSVVVEQVAPAR